MLYFDRIDVSEGTDVNKTRKSKDFDICHYWYFLDKGFRFHDLVMMSMDIAIINIKGSDYRCIISGISKSEAINLMQNTNLTIKKWKIIKQKSITTYKNG